MEMLATRIGSIEATGLKLTVVKRHKAKLTDTEYAEAQEAYKRDQVDAAKHPPGNFIAEPISGMQGSLSGEHDLGPWYAPWPDPDVTPRIVDGKIDFGDMTNFAVQLHTYNVERDGVIRPEDQIALGNAVDVRTLKDFKRKMPGFYGDAGSWNYGHINLRETIEGLANEPGTPPSREYEAAAIDDFTDFSGIIVLGDGRMGYDRDGDGLLGEGDNWVEFKRETMLQNAFTLKAASLGKSIDLYAAEFHMGGAGFTASETRDGNTRIGRTSDIRFEQVDVNISGLSSMTVSVTLKIQKSTILDVEIGDVMFTSPTELEKLTAPSVTDVDPTGVAASRVPPP